MTSEAAKERRRARDRLKRARFREKRRAAKLAQVAISGVSKTSPEYRRKLGVAADMTKGELRAMLATAVRNTQAMVRP